MRAPTICITTACLDLEFLDPIVNRLAHELGDDFEHVRIQCINDIDFALSGARVKLAPDSDVSFTVSDVSY